MEVEIPKEEGFQIVIPYNLFQYLSSDNCNIENLCRICLAENNMELYPLSSLEDSGSLQDMFTAFTAIQIHSQDGLPSHVCNLCKTQIRNCYEFKTQCIKADFTLKSLLKGFNKTETLEPKIESHSINEFTETSNVAKELQSTISYENNSFEINVKDEDVEDIQYLEDLSGSDSEALCIVQSFNKIRQESIDDSLTDVNPATKSKQARFPNAKKGKKKKQKSHACSVCLKKFSSRQAAQKHIVRAHGGGAKAEGAARAAGGGAAQTQAHSCGACAQAFHSAHDLGLHEPLHGPGPVWECVQCHKEFKGRSMFRRHIKRHMDAKQYSCEVCGKTFAELYALKRHHGVHTGARMEKKYACNLCDKRYSEGSLLAAHMSRHLGVRPCVCAECGKAFSSARLLTSHQRVHRDNKPYRCGHCDKRFRHESTLNTHARTHTGERPYVCAACGKRFIQSSNLTLHMRTHTGERPYSCATCGATFSSGSTLKAHTRRHTGDKPYSCQQCGKRFARPDLRAHMQSHSGSRPHACAVCARRFATPVRLREHERIHTGERPFECASCSQNFTHKTHLIKHMKKHQVKKKSPAAKNTSSKDKTTNQAEDLSTAHVLDKTKDSIDVIHAPDDTNVTEEVIISDEIPEITSIESGSVCLTTNNAPIAYPADVNLVTVDGSEVRIASSEGTTFKLYQLDQSLVQIHSSGGQFTISKITSKMTTNF